MKIGILTYHRTHNYGGCLQALATRTILEKMGHEVYYVDYWPEYHAAEYRLFNKQKYNKFTWKGKVKYLATFIILFKSIRKRYFNFELYHRLYTYPYCKSLNEIYDVVIYGSDQIWRKQNSTNNYNPIYFGINDIKANKHIAFSASMGILPTVQHDKETVKEYLSHLDVLAVREANLKDFLCELGFLKTINTIDPTLILTSEEWDRIIPTKRLIKDNYIVVYMLWGEVFDTESIRNYAINNKLKIVYLFGGVNKQETHRNFSAAGPETFLSLIKYAELVFTSSFHGLAFSLIYKKQFYTSFSSNSDRAKSLLNIVGLGNRYLENNASIPFDGSLIDYNYVTPIINSFAKESLKYLSKNIINL